MNNKGNHNQKLTNPSSHGKAVDLSDGTLVQTHPKQKRTENNLDLTNTEIKAASIRCNLFRPINAKFLFNLQETIDCLDEDKQRLKHKEIQEITFVFIAKIVAVNSEFTQYIFKCRDQTHSKEVALHCLKTQKSKLTNYYHQKPLESKKQLINGPKNQSEMISLDEISSLEFEPMLGEGWPYFKFLIKLQKNSSLEKAIIPTISINEEGYELSGQGEYKRANKKDKQLKWNIFGLRRVVDFNEIAYHNCQMMKNKEMLMNELKVENENEVMML